MWSFSLIIVAISLFNMVSAAILDVAPSATGELREYCSMETFKPRCPHGDVIVMRSAMFGRMRVGRCITSEAFQFQQVQPDSLGCSVDVLGYFDRMCSGQSSCDVLVPNPDLFNYRPCSAQLIMFLEASYSCVSVVDEDRSCSISAVVGSPVHVSSSSRSQQRRSDVIESRCGSKLNPWNIEAQTGQQINITLLDFNPQQEQEDQTKGVMNRVIEPLSDCTTHYGNIIDKSAAATSSKNTTICGGSHREQFVYQSKGSNVELVLSATESYPDSKQHKFLLGFQAVGCSNLVPPADAWLRRTDNEATVGCYTTRQRWHLRCERGQWKGTIGQCADTILNNESSQQMVVAGELRSEKHTLVNTLVITAVVFIGLAVCLIIIFVGIGCSRRYKRQLRAMKTGYSPTVQRTQQYVQKTVVGTSFNTEAAGTTSFDNRPQYFVLDRNMVENDSVVNTAT